MKDSLQKIISILYRAEETFNDEEFCYCINEAILQLESAKDRLTAIDEEFETEVEQLCS